MTGAGADISLLRVTLTGQPFALPVAGSPGGTGTGGVRDVLRTPALTRLPRVPAGFAGALNLRGRVVQAIDPRAALGLTPVTPTPPMAVVVAHGPDLYALLCDAVTGVETMPPELFAPLPATLPLSWATMADGVFQLPDALVVVLNVAGLLVAIAQPNA